MTERGAHYRVWSKVSSQTNPLGELEPRTNSYVELTTGLHFRDPVSGEWVESDPSFELTPESFAVARRCQHQVIISPNLNSPDGIVVDLQTPDGQRLRSGIAGLNLFDPVSGKSLQIAVVRNTGGTLVSSNEVVWFDAFDGLEADVRVRNERGQFHQDVLLREKLSANQLTSLGFNADTVRLEVWTEFVEAPEPVAQRIVLKTETNAALRATMVEPDEVDDVLKFGNEMQIGRGSAFIEDEPARATRVFKQWQETGGRRFLIEAVNYHELLPLLEALPVKTAALKTGDSTSALAANRLPPQRAKVSAMGTANGTDASRTTTVAKLNPQATAPSAPRVVLDYVVTLTSGANKTLQGDTTYYVSGTVNLSGTTTIEGGTVVKFANTASARINFTGPVVCTTSAYRPAIFTSKNDDSAGEMVSGSNHNPVKSTVNACLVNSGYSQNSYKYLRFAFGGTGLNDPYMIDLWHSQSISCSLAINAGECDVLLRNALFVQCGTCVDTTEDIDGQHLTVDACTRFAHQHVNGGTVVNSISTATTVGGVSLSYSWQNPSSSGVYESIGAGSHYLADNTHRNQGTTAINPTLANDLKRRTTYAPDELTGHITADTPLSARPIRDTQDPDRGYHYDPLDWVVNAKNVSAVLTLNSGVAIGTYGSAASYGLAITGIGSLASVGLPANLNWIVRYNTVQEQSTSAWSSSTVGPSVRKDSSTATVTAEFTGWSLLAGVGEHLNDSAGGTANAFRDCQFGGGRASPSTKAPRPSSTACGNGSPRLLTTVMNSWRSPLSTT